eukprot:1062601_1
MSVNDLSLANDIVVQQLRSVFRHFWRPLGAKHEGEVIKFDTVYYADNLALGFNFRNKAYKSEGSIKGAMNVRRLCHLHGIDDPNITNWMHCGMVQPCMRYLGFDSIRYGRELWKHDRYCNLTTEQRAEEEELDKCQQFQYYWMTPHPDLFDA